MICRVYCLLFPVIFQIISCSSGGSADNEDAQANDLVDKDSQDIADQSDQFFFPDSELPGYPVQNVNFTGTEKPAGDFPDFSPYYPEYCSGNLPTEPWVPPSCPELAFKFSCPSLGNPGASGAWLKPEMAPLLCSICNYSEGHCECKEGVDYKFYGLGGSVCINVIIHDGNEPRILKNVSEFSSTFAPVEDKAEALAFVDLAVHRTRHLFTREEFIAAATHVEGGYYSHKAACLKEHITGTSAGETPDGYVVSTFLVPDPNGCIKEAIVEIKVLVTKQGVLKILSEEALCLAYEGMACYD